MSALLLRSERKVLKIFDGYSQYYEKYTCCLWMTAVMLCVPARTLDLTKENKIVTECIASELFNNHRHIQLILSVC